VPPPPDPFNPAPPPPPPVPWVTLGPQAWDRLGAYGSRHTSGVNFSFADGSVRVFSQTTSQDIILAASTRSGGESGGTVKPPVIGNQ